jgi:hypothetical protein
MPFNSETAKEAGTKSKRGKAKHSSEIREMLSDLATQTLNNIALEQSALRKGLKAKRTEMSVKCLSVFSKFVLFFEMFKN